MLIVEGVPSILSNYLMEVYMQIGLLIGISIITLGVEIANRKNQNKTLQWMGILGKASLGAMSVGLIPVISKLI
jgi:hypothetical protein